MTTISEEMVFGRPPVLKVFVSSKMRRGAFRVERAAAIAAIDGMRVAVAWAWEKSAEPGAYCSEAICVGHAATADVLILILGSDLTEITELEYRAAEANQAQRVILVQEGVRRTRAAQEFLRQEQAANATTKNFQNASELQAHIVSAIDFHLIQSSRHAQLARRAAHQPRRSGWASTVWRRS